MKFVKPLAGMLFLCLVAIALFQPTRLAAENFLCNDRANGQPFCPSAVAQFLNGTAQAVSVSATNPLPVTQGVAVTSTARGLTLTLGGTSQQLMAVNAARHGFVLQNPCTATEQGIAAAEDAFINLTGAATTNTAANFAVLTPCSSIAMGLSGGYVSTEAVNVVAATTGHILYAKEF